MLDVFVPIFILNSKNNVSIFLDSTARRSTRIHKPNRKYLVHDSSESSIGTNLNISNLSGNTEAVIKFQKFITYMNANLYNLFSRFSLALQFVK